MSYQVLARKWRPGKFSELVGQEHVVSAISNALDNDRLHHAYLFTGTRGVGKTTIARIFSKSLNCEQGQGANPCGQCNTCKEIEQGNYVDLLEIDAASRTKVEDTRELLDNVQYKPTRGRYKVYLIDEVHMLSKHSFNALLKTLEEPPPHVKFLLATTDPQKLPITILSRCLQFNLKALSREQIVGQLTYILEQETLPFEPQALALLARAAQGSMRDALSLTDQAIAQGGNAVNASVVTDMLGLMDKNQLVKLLHAVVSKTPAEVMQLVQDMSEQAPDYDHVLAELGSTLHQIALTQWVPEACKLETTSAKAIYQLAKSISAEQVQLLYQIALQGRKDLPFSADGRSALEMTLMRMMTFAPSTPLSDAPTQISEGQSDTALPISSTEKKTLTTDKPDATGLNSNADLAVDSNADLPVDSNTDVPVDSNANIPTETNGNATEAQIASAPKPEEVSLTVETPHADVTEAPVAPDNAASSAETESAASPLDTAPVAPQTPPMPFDDMPPPDAYMDEMPPPSDADHSFHSDAYFDGNNNSNSNAQAEALAESLSYPQEQSSAPEVQLTSTADMLAIRQRLKQRKEQDNETAAQKTEGVEQSDNLVARMSKASGSASLQTEAPAQTEVQPSASETITSPDDADAPPWETQAHGPLARTTSPHANQSLIQPDAQQSSEPEPALAEVVPQNSNPHGHLPAASSEGADSKLNAYLDDGSKLVHASQIDHWSNLVEQMPIAGLLKQLVLHASFLKNDQGVTLEIDDSQAHLLNDSAKQQLLDVLHHSFGEGVNISISLGSPSQTPFALQQDIQAMRQAHAHTVVSTDETIQALLSAFDASVVTDSVKAR